MTGINMTRKKSRKLKLPIQVETLVIGIATGAFLSPFVHDHPLGVGILLVSAVLVLGWWESKLEVKEDWFGKLLKEDSEDEYIGARE